MIKFYKQLSLSLLLVLFGPSINAQQVVSDFENLTLESDSEWHGEDGSGGFSSGSVVFINNYNAGWDAWNGFSYSNKVDKETAGYGNQYSVFNTSGYNNSSNFAIVNANANARVRPKNKGEQIVVKGFYITNTTYTVLAIKTGDQFTKKFGGKDGDDKDSLIVTARGYVDGEIIEDSVNFVLADFRFEDNSNDYILDTWEWFDLSSLGYVDSVVFEMYSSDTGQWGINTPTYFAMDNFTVETLATNIKNSATLSFNAYPNPAINNLQLDLSSVKGSDIDVRILDLQGKELIQLTVNGGEKPSLDISSLISGLYIVTIRQNDEVSSLRLIKQ